MTRRSLTEILPPVLAAFAFTAFAVVFAFEIFAYQRSVTDWARRDLHARALLAAGNLAEPLATQDFGALRAFGDACRDDGVRLRVTTARGGCLYDSEPSSPTDNDFWEESESGEYRVAIAVPSARVLAPFRRALYGFLLAAMVGVFGVALFFLVAYRQRVRIRELARLERFRREFVADVSHEIKTPLTGILGAVDLLSGNPQEPAVRMRLLALLKGEATRLNALVQGILTLARLDRESPDLPRKETDLGILAAETVGRLEGEAARRGLSLAFAPPSAGADLNVLADASQVERALENLIVNAIRHSGSKTVLVSLTPKARTLELAVEDRGVGIRREHRERIFERFYRVDASRAAETGGSGLGLAIVRSIARAHGGDAWLESVEPSGCRFVIALPRRRRVCG